MRHPNVSEPHWVQIGRWVGIRLFRVLRELGIVTLALIWSVGIDLAVGSVAIGWDGGIQLGTAFLLLGLALNLLFGYWPWSWIEAVVPRRWLFKDEDPL